MTAPMTRSMIASPEVFSSLEHVCERSGLDHLALRLIELRTWLADDLVDVERALAAVGQGASLAQKTARHLLDQGGKRLRPICVALAARVGGGFTDAARQYALAV